MASSAPPHESSALSCADQLLQAVASISDLAAIHADPEIGRLRSAVLQHDYRDSALAPDLTRAVEVWGIAKAVALRFPNDYGANGAFRSAVFFMNKTIHRFEKSEPDPAREDDSAADASPRGTDREAFRALLRAHLGWVHAYGTLADGAPGAAAACLSPATAYLQFAVQEAPAEHWAAALSPATEPGASPLSFALALARRSPGVGKETADVALLVSMGCRILERMREERRRRERERGEVAEPSGAQRWFSGLASLVYGAPADAQNHRPEPYSGDELLETVSNLVRLLQQDGERYARLLGKEDGAEERAGIADSIRLRVHAILVSTDLSVSDALVEAVDGLVVGDG